MRVLQILSALLLVLADIGFTQTACAQEPVGRYQMVPLPTKPGSFDSRVMILDTSDGHLWQWWEAPAVGSSVPSTGITYLGKVTPGGSVGETTPTHRAEEPESTLPKH